LKNHIYDAANRLVSGTNEKGEISQYTYNELGMGVQTNQSMLNENAKYRDNKNSTGSTRLGDVSQYLDQNKPENYSQWQNGTGMNRAEDYGEIVRNYTIDFTSVTNRDILITESGRYAQRIVYGLDKISATIGEIEEIQPNLKKNIE
jgi:hypothetical protein